MSLLQLEIRIQSSFKEHWFEKKTAQFNIDRSHVHQGLSEKADKIAQMDHEKKLELVQRRLIRPRRSCVKSPGFKYHGRISRLSKLPGESYRLKRAESGWTWTSRPRDAKILSDRPTVDKIAEKIAQRQDRLITDHKSQEEVPKIHRYRSKNIFRQIANIRQLARNFKAGPAGFSRGCQLIVFYVGIYMTSQVAVHKSKNVRDFFVFV